MQKTITKYIRGLVTDPRGSREETLTVCYSHKPLGDSISIAINRGEQQIKLHVPFEPVERMIKEAKKVTGGER